MITIFLREIYPRLSPVEWFSLEPVTIGCLHLVFLQDKFFLMVRIYEATQKKKSRLFRIHFQQKCFRSAIL